MRPRFTRTFVPLLALSAGLVAVATPVASSYASEPRVVVAGTSALPAGAVVVNQPMSSSFDVALTGTNASSLNAFLLGLSTPSSPNYRHFLTTAQFAQRFGASPATVARVSSYFKSFGLRVGSLSKGHVMLHVSGPGTAIARAFDTSVLTVRRSDGVVVPQITSSATLPRSIASDVVGVAGLSSVRAPTPGAVTAHTSSRATVPQSCPSAGDSTTNSPNALGGYTLQQQARLYGLSSQWASGHTGAGQVIGVYELGAYNPSDISTYTTCYGISPSITTVNVDGGPGTTPIDEATLDIEEATGLAPGAAIKVYQGPNSNTGPTDTYQQMADDNTATIITTSWGTCEADPNGSPNSEQPIFQQMAAQGQTVFSAAGDSGSSDCAGTVNNQLAVDDPASQPFVTAVGGLSVNSINPLSQTVWNNGSSGGAGGGGLSALWSRPTWQNAPGIAASATMRMVPDLSVMGDPGTGFIEYFTGSTSCTTHCHGWSSIGGTSIGSPIMSAVTAIAAQSCGVARLGFLNPTLYSMASTGFIDVTTGTNDIYAAGGYNAGPGYDMASGLGSPNPTTFIPDLCPIKFDLSKSSFSTSAPIVLTNTNGTSITAVLRDSNNNPMANAIVAVTATGTAGRIVINGDRSSSSGSGRATYNLTTDNTGTTSFTVSDTEPGAVLVTVTYQAQPVYTSTLSFVTVLAKSKSLVPGRPTISKVTATIGGFVLNVRTPSVAGANPVTALQYSLNGGRTWTTVRSLASVRAAGLAKGRVYSVVIRALNSAGPGPWSSTIKVITRLK